MHAVNHQKHEKIAVFAFLAALLIAAGSFYYIWQVQARFGLSPAGTQALAQIQWTREQLIAEQPAQLNQELLEMKGPCCDYLQHATRASSLKINARGRGYCFSDPLAQELITKGGYVLVDIEQGSCPR